MYVWVTAESGQKPDSGLGLELGGADKPLFQKKLQPPTSLQMLVQAKWQDGKQFMTPLYITLFTLNKAPQPLLESSLEILHSLDPEKSRRNSQGNQLSGTRFGTAAMAKQAVKQSTRVTGFQSCLKPCLETPGRISGSATPSKKQLQGKQSLVGRSQHCFSLFPYQLLQLTGTVSQSHYTLLVSQKLSMPSRDPASPVLPESQGSYSAPIFGHSYTSRHRWTLAVFRFQCVHMKLYFSICLGDTASVS